jgi:hypothetical protein
MLNITSNFIFDGAKKKNFTRKLRPNAKEFSVSIRKTLRKSGESNYQKISINDDENLKKKNYEREWRVLTTQKSLQSRLIIEISPGLKGMKITGLYGGHCWKHKNTIKTYPDFILTDCISTEELYLSADVRRIVK